MFGFSSIPSSATRWSCSSVKTACRAREVTWKRALDRVVAVHQHLGLDDRDEARLLRERGVAGERVRVRPDAVLARDPVADRDHGAPLGEPRAELAVLREALAQAVEALGDLLARRERERLRALVDLDPGDDPEPLEQLRERLAVGRALADRLVEEDHAADVLGGARGREEQLAVGAPVLLGRVDADRVEALRDRAVALVGGEDPLPGRDECAGCFLEPVMVSVPLAAHEAAEGDEADQHDRITPRKSTRSSADYDPGDHQPSADVQAASSATRKSSSHPGLLSRSGALRLCPGRGQPRVEARSAASSPGVFAFAR